MKNGGMKWKGFKRCGMVGFVNRVEEVVGKENGSEMGIGLEGWGGRFGEEGYEG